MTDWIKHTDWKEHDGGPQPVDDDVWVEAYVTKPPLRDVSTPRDGPASIMDWLEVVEYRVLNQHLIDAKQAEIDALQHEVMWLHNALEQTEEAVVYGYTLLDDMDAKIDAARLEGIRLGLEAAEKIVWKDSRWMGSDGPSIGDRLCRTLRTLNPDTIAREAVLDQLTSEAQAQGMGYDND